RGARADRRGGAAPPARQHRARPRARRRGRAAARGRSGARADRLRALARRRTRRDRPVAPAALEAAARPVGPAAAARRGPGHGRSHRDRHRGGRPAMRMRTKLVFAQLPLVAALAVTMIVASYITHGLAGRSRDILKDNYRSVLAAQNIKEAAERIDSGVMFAIAGRAADGRAQIDAHIAKLDHEVVVQEANITEPGEREATAKLRAAWTAYAADIAALRDALNAPDL